MSGIYKAGVIGSVRSSCCSEMLTDARKGYYERFPYDQRSIRSIYYTRQYNVNRLTQVRLPSFPFSSLLMPSQLTNPDILISHDWPQSIERQGNLKALLKLRPGFRTSVDADTLGSPPSMLLLKSLKPKWWFAGNMHVRFEAEVNYARDTERTQRGEQNQKSGVGKEKEIQDNERTTKILALIPILTSLPTLPSLANLHSFLPAGNRLPPSSSPVQLTFDPEWLAITRAFHPFLSLEHAQVPFPREAEAERFLRYAREWVGRNVFQVPEGRDQSLPISQPSYQAQGQEDGGGKQLSQAEGGAQHQPQAEGEAPQLNDGTSHPSQSEGRTESPPKYTRKLVEEVQRFVKTAPGVEETPEREWKGQRTFSFSFLRPHLCRLCVSLSICMLFLKNFSMLFYQIVRASLSTYTLFSSFSLVFALFPTFIPVFFSPARIPRHMVSAFCRVSIWLFPSPFPFLMTSFLFELPLHFFLPS